MIYKHQLLTLLLLTSTVLPVHARQVEEKSDATSVGTPPTPRYKVLYSFTGGTDGGDSDSALVRDWQGNLYGTTIYGGLINNNCPAGGSPSHLLQVGGDQLHWVGMDRKQSLAGHFCPVTS